VEIAFHLRLETNGDRNIVMDHRSCYHFFSGLS
jgi:hypothetical protein